MKILLVNNFVSGTIFRCYQRGRCRYTKNACSAQFMDINWAMLRLCVPALFAAATRAGLNGGYDDDDVPRQYW